MAIENMKLNTELEAFKIICRSLVFKNKKLKAQAKSEKEKDVKQTISYAKIHSLNVDNQKLKSTNFKLLLKL